MQPLTRPRYKLILEALPGPLDADLRLKRALKYLLRACGFRCRHVSLVSDRGDGPVQP